MNPPVTRNAEELVIFVERVTHFMNLWTVYTDALTGKYVPSVGAHDHSMHDPRTTIMLVLYGYFYSLIEDSPDGINAFRIWREHFPEEDQAISAVEAQILPFTDDLRVFRNRLGFHGSRSRAHESKGFDFFANATGTATWNAMKNFKALAAILLAKDMASKKSDDAEAKKYRKWIDAIAARAKEQSMV